jgi:hypothetical protein
MYCIAFYFVHAEAMHHISSRYRASLSNESHSISFRARLRNESHLIFCTLMQCIASHHLTIPSSYLLLTTLHLHHLPPSSSGEGVKGGCTVHRDVAGHHLPHEHQVQRAHVSTNPGNIGFHRITCDRVAISD